MGIAAFAWPRVGWAILNLVAVIYTIPSLALLVMMIPLLGIGAWPAITALFLYGLLPIVRNTHAGLAGIPSSLRESAIVLGLPPVARLLRIELPLAMPSIMAGIKTAAVMSIGTATLGALIGAGGYGQPILTGIRLADNHLILLGAIPSAVMALAAQGFFGLLERLTVPRGLRLPRASLSSTIRARDASSFFRSLAARYCLRRPLKIRLHGLLDDVHRHAFFQALRGTGPPDFPHHILHVCHPRKKENGPVSKGRLLPEDPCEGETIDAGHSDVHQYQVGPKQSRPFHGGLESRLHIHGEVTDLSSNNSSIGRRGPHHQRKES